MPLLRQSVYPSEEGLAGYEDTNPSLKDGEAGHPSGEGPLCRLVVGRRALEKQAASTNTLSRFETEVLVTEENLKGLNQSFRRRTEWVDQAMMRTRHQRIILDMDSSESPVYGEQEGAAYPSPKKDHFECVCYHPLFCFNQFGDCEGAMLRPGNVHPS